MPFSDPFFRELILLGSLIREIREAKCDSLPKATQYTLQKADALFSSRALTVLQDTLHKAKEAMPEDMAQTASSQRSIERRTDFSAHSTVPANTSSQPSPEDLAGHLIGD